MRRTAARLWRTAVPIALAAAVAAGCADAPVSTTPASVPAAAPGAQPAAQQRAADVAYAQMMMPHVVQGVELSEMVPGRAANPDLTRLVLLMDNTDVEEQGQLAGQLHLWHAAVPGEAGVPLGTMPGMADAAQLDRLRALSGPAFDRAWIDTMITHHQGGVDMSRGYLAAATDPALENIADAQVQVGTRQIAQMQALRTAA